MQLWMIKALRRQQLRRDELRRSREAQEALQPSLPGGSYLQPSPQDEAWRRAENMPGANENPYSNHQRGVWISTL